MAISPVFGVTVPVSKPKTAMLVFSSIFILNDDKSA